MPASMTVSPARSARPSLSHGPAPRSASASNGFAASVAIAASAKKFVILQQEKHELERIVCVDSLTGLANRRHALSLLDAEWKRSVRDGTPLSLVIIDLDHFHAFNETYGHPGGDTCLRRVTAEMVNCLRRPSDFLGRYGGEEFIAVLANTDAMGARIVAERLRIAVEELAIPHSGSSCANKVVTISVGFATILPKSEKGVDSADQESRHALLSAKSTGRNQDLR